MKYRCPKCTMIINIKNDKIPKVCPMCNMRWDKDKVEEKIRGDE